MRIGERSHLCAVNILATASRGLTGLLRTFKVRRERVQTEFQNIFGGVQIAVHHMAAVADHHPPVEWHLVELTTSRTHFATGREAVDDRYRPAAQGRLVLDHPPKRSESSIIDRTGKPVVFSHAAHIQIFDADHFVVAGQVVRHLVQYRMPLVGLESAPFIYAARSRQAASMNFSGSVRVSP